MSGMYRLMLAASAGLGLHSAMGGWAVITVENPPEYLESGGSYRIEYTVRQHGRDPLDGLRGTVRVQPASSPGEGTSFLAIAGAGRGRYSATIALPAKADQVRLTVRSGFSGNGWGDLTLMSIPVLPPGQARPSLRPQERGRRLFVAKGCGTCHLNRDVPEFAKMNRVLEGVAPELTGRRLEPDYVRQRLTDPSSLPQIGTGAVRMPALGLATNEVEALVTLLSGPVQSAGQ